MIEKCSLLTNTVLEMPVINFLFVDGSAAYPQSPLFFTAILYDLFYDLCSLSLFNFGKLFLICLSPNFLMWEQLEGSQVKNNILKNSDLHK